MEDKKKKTVTNLRIFLHNTTNQYIFYTLQTAQTFCDFLY